MNFNKENIKTEKSIGRESRQAVTTGELIVPDNLPDAAEVLEVIAHPVIENVSTGENRVNYKGHIPVEILYIAKGDKSLQSMHGNIEINDFIDVEGAEENMVADLSYIISDVSSDVINERKIGCKILSDVDVSVKEPIEIEAVISIEDTPEIPPEQQKTKTIRINTPILDTKENFEIKDSISLPNSKPNIEKILQCTAVVSDKSVRCHKDRIDIGGEVSINAIYKGEEENNPMETAEGKLDFNGSIPLENADNANCNVKLDIEQCLCTIAEDNDGENRVIDVDVVMGCTVDADNEYGIDVLEDAYSLNKNIDMKEEEITYDLNVCTVNSQYPIKEIIELDEGDPDIMQIFKVDGMPYIDDISIEDDKINVSGVINVNILYVTESDDMPVYSAKKSIPFSQTIEAKGAKDDMNVSIDRDISNIRFNMLSGREVEIRCVLNMQTEVNREVCENICTDIEMTDMNKEDIKKIPGMVIYIVKPGDTLWKLSKKFNSTVDSIAEMNGIENPDLIYPEQKLIIVKMPMK